MKYLAYLALISSAVFSTSTGSSRSVLIDDSDGRPALASHLNSLRLLRLGEAVEASQRRAVLDGLQDLLAHTRQELSPT